MNHLNIPTYKYPELIFRFLYPNLFKTEHQNHFPSMASETPDNEATPLALSIYSKRVLISTILSSQNDAGSLTGQRVVVGGWVKSSREFRKDAPAPAPEFGLAKRDLTCVEVFQTKLPFFRSILKALGGEQRVKEKFDSIFPKPQQQSQPLISILQISDGSGVSSLQVVVDSTLASPIQVMATGTCILVEGILRKPFLQGKKTIEVNTQKILHLGTVDQDRYPLSRMRLPLESLRDSAHFRPRTTTVACVMRIRSVITQGTQTFFQQNGFLHVQIPIITSTDCEGFGDNFTVTSLLETKPKVDAPKTTDLASLMEAEDRKNYSDVLDFSKDYFCCRMFLSVSGRLHLESYAAALGNVYGFGPRFRSCPVESNKFLAEMWMAEVEMAFTQLQDSMECAMDFLKFISKWTIQNCMEDLNFLSKRVDKLIVDRLQLLANASFEKISYTEALQLLKKRLTDQKIEWGSHLSEEHERYLVDEVCNKPVIIYNHPMGIKPFSAHLNDDGKTAATFDVIIPKVGSLIRGSQNEERYNVLRKRIKEFDRQQQQQYEWYLDLHKNGWVKCSGFSFSLDVFVLYATGLNDLKDAVPFPRSIGKAKN